jgi:hypothetical protein
VNALGRANDGAHVWVPALELLQRMLNPGGGRGGQGNPAKVTVTLPSGEVVTGRLAFRDEFTIALRDTNGWYRSWSTALVKHTVDNPVEAHFEQLKKYTDADMHNVLAYVQTMAGRRGAPPRRGAGHAPGFPRSAPDTGGGSSRRRCSAARYVGHLPRDYRAATAALRSHRRMSTLTLVNVPTDCPIRSRRPHRRERHRLRHTADHMWAVRRRAARSAALHPKHGPTSAMRRGWRAARLSDDPDCAGGARRADRPRMERVEIAD